MAHVERADTFKKRVEKLQNLLHIHRRQVFNANGEAHHRALLRLKRTDTFRRMCQENDYAAQIRAGERLTGMGY